jgi:hypothetical protein
MVIPATALRLGKVQGIFISKQKTKAKFTLASST